MDRLSPLFLLALQQSFLQNSPFDAAQHQICVNPNSCPKRTEMKLAAQTPNIDDHNSSSSVESVSARGFTQGKYRKSHSWKVSSELTNEQQLRSWNDIDVNGFAVAFHATEFDFVASRVRLRHNERRASRADVTTSQWHRQQQRRGFSYLLLVICP